MNRKEKEKLAIKLLKKHDYSDDEIKRILIYSFGTKKERDALRRKK
jgi:hypothetical protein